MGKSLLQHDADTRAWQGLMRGQPALRDWAWPLQADAAAAESQTQDDSQELLSLVIDLLDQGLAVVTPDARLLLANQAFRRACGEGRAMRLVEQQLEVPGEQRASLQRALQQAQQGKRTLLMLQSGEDKTWVATVPLHRPWAGAAQPVLLMLGRRQLCEQVSLALFASNHRLTAAESAVLRQLGEGLRPDAIAQNTQVAVSTVRTQISSIREKTGTASVGELLRLLSGLPPLPSMVGQA